MTQLNPRRLPRLALLLAWATTATARAAESPLYLVRDGKAAATIVVAKAEGREANLVNSSAAILQSHIRQITGANLPKVDDGKPVSGPAIHVGRTSYVKGLGIPWQQVDRDGVVMKRVGDNLILAGGGPQGVRNAATLFLDDVCGVRWYIPGDLWKIVPQARDLAVGDLDRVENPHYLSRSLSGVIHERWLEWNRADWPTRYHVTHNIGKVIPPSLYDQHPEYFPLIGGSRVRPAETLANWQPCVSHSDVVKIAVEAARRHFDEKPDAELFSLAQNDNYGWCQCPQCVQKNGGLKYDPVGHQNWSDLYFSFLNDVCKELEKTHPRKKIGTFAYECGTREPPSLPIHRNLLVKVVNDRSRFHFDQGFREHEKAFLARWAKTAKAFSFHNWHYGTRYLIPRMELKSTEEFLRYGHEIGAVAYHGEEYPNYGLDGPKTYITARLLWNVNASADAILADFCQKCFPSAAAPMRRYFDALEDAWNTQPILNVGYMNLYLWRADRRQLRIFTPAVVERCCGHLDDALRAADNDTVRDRIEHFRKTFRVTAYWAQREAVYRGVRLQQHLTPATFAELVHNLNSMHYTTAAQGLYVQERIRGDLLTFHNARPDYIPMDVCYCELGSGLAEVLARRAAADLKKPVGQEPLAAALQARFDELAKVMSGPAPDPAAAGAAWKPFESRIRHYLGATSLVPRIQAPPKLDGPIDAGPWKGTPQLSGFKVSRRTRVLDEESKFPTTVRLAYDDDALYVACRCQEEDLRHVVDRNDRRDSAVWQDDAVDIVVLPSGTPADQFYHYIFNAKGTLYDAKGSGPASAAWSSALKVAATRDAASNTWTVALAIPWSDFGRKPASGEVWRAQFGRIDIRNTGMEISSWAPTTKGLNNADDLGVLLFE